VQAQTEAKNHGLVLKDASLERAARGIINSTFGCAGMRCMALPVICVENAVAEEFISYLVKFAKERVVAVLTTRRPSWARSSLPSTRSSSPIGSAGASRKGRN